MRGKKAFSLIEVIVSTGILTVTVFGIYKLIGENNKIVKNSDNFLAQNLVYENARECLKGENFDKKYLDFGSDLKDCNFSDQEKITKIDNIDYTILAKSRKMSGRVVFWDIIVESSVLGKGEMKTYRE